jgi:uncharacterized protein
MGISAPPTRRPRWRQWYFICVRAIRRVLHLSDTPHRIAIGSAAGLFVMPLPIPGQFVLGPVLAKLVRGNVVASIPWTWVNNPFTVLFFIYGQYRLGLLFVRGSGDTLSFAALGRLFERLQDMPWGRALSEGLEVVGDILLPLAVGTGLAGVALAVSGYLVIFRLVVAAQRKKKARYAHWRRSGPSDGRGVDMSA